MLELWWKPILAWALAAFFALGSAINISAPESVVADYRRWGYPDWFHFVTGGLELTSAALLLLPLTRLPGAGLASAIMLAATTTVIAHGEYVRVVLPVVIFALSVIVGWTSLR
jgi:DoxX-like family